MDPLYQEHILEHYKRPHNKRKMLDADVVQRGHNVSCGDELTLYLKFQNDMLADVSFTGVGCAISQSGVSMLTDKMKGMTRNDLSRLGEEDMYELYGTEISPSREKCALLALNTLRLALAKNSPPPYPG
jgi:nitrogen fixation NifU-like protein